MSIDFGSVNFIAVLVSAFATFMVGGLWYAAIFGKMWVEVNEFNESQIAAMGKQQGRNFAIFIIGDLVMAIVISLLAANLGISGWAQGAVLGLMLGIGVSATQGAAKNAANNKSFPAFAIDVSHQLVCLVVMGAILGAWR